MAYARGSSIAKRVRALGRFVLAPLAALLLAAHPAALQLHALSHSQTNATRIDDEALRKALSQGESGHRHGSEKGECPVCKLLGLMASSSFELQASEPWSSGWPKLGDSSKDLSKGGDPGKPLARSSLARAPPETL